MTHPLIFRIRNQDTSENITLDIELIMHMTVAMTVYCIYFSPIISFLESDNLKDYLSPIAQ